MSHLDGTLRASGRFVTFLSPCLDDCGSLSQDEASWIPESFYQISALTPPKPLIGMNNPDQKGEKPVL